MSAAAPISARRYGTSHVPELEAYSPETKKYTEINTHEDRFHYRGHRLGGGDRPEGFNMNSGVGRAHR
jgi:hypothetical protein